MVLETFFSFLSKRKKDGCSLKKEKKKAGHFAFLKRSTTPVAGLLARGGLLCGHSVAQLGSASKPLASVALCSRLIPASHRPSSPSPSLSPLCPSFTLRSLCHREHKLFSHWPRRLNDWCVQTTRARAGMTCSLDPSPSPASAALHAPAMSVLAAIPHYHPPIVSHLRFFFFFHEVGLHKPLPWESRASSLFCTPETQLTGN